MMRRAALAAALLVTGAVIWPLGPLGQQLFAFHMAQHLLLIALAAPLAVLGGVRIKLRPVFAWTLFVGTFLFWHVPAAFQAAALHHLTLVELASILFTAIIFWSAVLGDSKLSDGARALMVMMAAVATDLPGVVMLFAPRAICVMPGENAAAFGLTPLEDQQLAGLFMWVPANLVFFAIATFLFARWISDKHLVTS
jgi:cytochrome c oxidase assembly factor CtaG